LFEGEKSQGTFAYVGVTRHKIKILHRNGSVPQSAQLLSR